MGKKKPPYLPVSLDAKKLIPKVAKVAGMTPGDVLWGLTELWEYVWQTRASVIGELALEGCFGSAPKVVAALVEFGFIEPDEHAAGFWEVCGAALWLGVISAKSRAGKARSAGERDALGRLTSSTSPADGPALTPRSPAPSTQHPAPTAAAATEKNLPRVIEPPTTPPDTWTGPDFERWCQSRRQAAGLIPEKHHPPNQLASWFSAATMTPGVTVAALKAGFLAFGADEYWEKQGFPFRAYLSQWDKYTRKELKHAAAG